MPECNCYISGGYGLRSNCAEHGGRDAAWYGDRGTLDQMPLSKEAKPHYCYHSDETHTYKSRHECDCGDWENHWSRETFATSSDSETGS